MGILLIKTSVNFRLKHVLPIPKYVLPNRHLECVAQGLPVMGECSPNNKTSGRKGGVFDAFSDTLSGAFPPDKNVSVTSEKTVP